MKPDHEHVTEMSTVASAVKETGASMLANLREAADIAKAALRERNAYFIELCELRTRLRTAFRFFGFAIVRLQKGE